MDVENTFIKPVLLFYFGKGISELEAHKEITKQYGQYAVTYKTIIKWFKLFRTNERKLSKKGPTKSKLIFEDEFLVDLVNDNPDASVEKLASLAHCSVSNMYRRLSKINSKKLNGSKISLQRRAPNLPKNGLLFTDEYLINLIKENEGLSMRELAKLANCSKSTISSRLKQINSDRTSDSKIVLQSSAFNAPRRVEPLTDDFIINLINENPGLSMTNLAKLAKVCTSTISKRLKIINSNRENDSKILLNNTYNSARKPKKFTNEYLVNLINENPGLDMEELAKLANCSKSTICKRLKEIDINSEEIKHRMRSPQKGNTKFTDEFLINLISENPGICAKELARLANCSRSSISIRLKKVNSTIPFDTRINLQVSTSGLPKVFTDEYLIDLINENPSLNMKELARIAKVSPKTISNRIKKINNESERVKYSKKYVGKSKKFSDEYLVNIINNNPNLNYVELAKLANCTASTLFVRLNEINENRESDSKISLQKCTPNASRKKLLFTDEFLIKLINDNPDFNMSQLAALANASVATISNRLKQINSKEERVSYCRKDGK
jgi:predicted transcriptional regulator